MRKLLCAVAITFVMAGLVVAAEGTITKVDTDKKEITVKDKDDKEVTLKYTDKVKVTIVSGKKGEEKESEGKFEDWERRLKKFDPAGKGNRLTYEAKDGEITAVKIRGGKKN